MQPHRRRAERSEHDPECTEALAAVPAAVREIVEATPDVRFDRCHLLRCTPLALQFEVVFFVMDGNPARGWARAAAVPIVGQPSRSTGIERWSAQDDPHASYHVEWLKCG